MVSVHQQEAARLERRAARCHGEQVALAILHVLDDDCIARDGRDPRSDVAMTEPTDHDPVRCSASARKRERVVDQRAIARLDQRLWSRLRQVFEPAAEAGGHDDGLHGGISSGA